MPNIIKNNVSFKSSNLNDISIAALAEIVNECTDGQVDSNALSELQDSQGNRVNRENRGEDRENKDGSGQNDNHSGQDSRRGSKKDIQCWFCLKFGHRMAECYHFIEQKKPLAIFLENLQK